MVPPCVDGDPLGIREAVAHADDRTRVWRDTPVMEQSSAMVTWQLTVDARDPALLVEFWAPVLAYEPSGPEDPYVHRIVDPTGHGPPIWFQKVPEPKDGKNRLHVDIYPTGQDRTLSLPERKRLVDARVVELVAVGATVDVRIATADDYHVIMRDPEGNEFCVG
jgi:hypothetical protein